MQAELIAHISLTAIVRNPDQPRPDDAFDPASLAELARSIKAAGLLQPITLRSIEKAEAKAAGNPKAMYMIVAGERRFRAHLALQASGTLPTGTIAAHVKDMSVAEMHIAAIVENLQRSDIRPLDEARAFQRLVDQGLTVDAIAKAVGAVPFRVRWRLKLLALDPTIQTLVKGEQLPVLHALEIAGLEPRDQIALVKRYSRGEMTTINEIRAAVQKISDQQAQTSFLDDVPADDCAYTDKDAATFSAMEKKIDRVASMVGAGFVAGECKVLDKVPAGKARLLADRISALLPALRAMEKDLRRGAVQSTLSLEPQRSRRHAVDNVALSLLN